MTPTIHCKSIGICVPGFARVRLPAISLCRHALISSTTFSLKHNNEINGLKVLMKVNSVDVSVAPARGALLSSC